MRSNRAVFNSEVSLRIKLPVSSLLAVLALFPTAAAARPPGLTLAAGHINTMVSVENDMSVGKVGELSSIAPDVHVGVTDDLTVSLVTSASARAGSRGSAGNGLCATSGCARIFDNAGLEALYTLARGDLAIAANAGLHATSFDDGRYLAKLGFKLRYRWHRFTFATSPSALLAATGRDAAKPARDRVWLPVVATYPIVGRLAAGAVVVGRAPIDSIRTEYEIGAGVIATYALSPTLLVGASWIQSRPVAADGMVPAGTSPYDYRALQLWVSATR